MNTSRREFKQRQTLCRNRKDEIIGKENKILEMQAENFEKRFNVRNEFDLNESQYEEVEDNRERDNIPTLEVISAIERIENNKAPGIDGLPVELLKYSTNNLEEHICQVVQQMWKQIVLLGEWNINTIIPIFKKGDYLSCDNYRMIMLLNTSSKILPLYVLAYILYDHLLRYTEKIIGWCQSEFCGQKSTIDQILLLRYIPEKIYEYGIDTYCLFIDFKSVYGSVAGRAQTLISLCI